MKTKKSPVGRRSLLGLICFYWTDAIAGISGGTEIKYDDLYKGYDVSSYSRLIGVMLIYSPISSIGYAVVASGRYSSCKLGIVYIDDGSVSITSDTSYKIRVYYY